MIVAPPLLLLALQAAPGAGPGSALTPFILEIGLLFVVFYFLLMRPQQKQRKQQEAALRALKKGDEVVTAGGIIGEVVHIKETMKDGAPAPAMDDRITIKSADARLVVERGRIARVAPKAGDGGSTP